MPETTVVPVSKSIIADLLMIVFVVVFPHTAGLPMFIYPLVVLVVLWVYLRWTGRTFSAIGFRWSDLSWKSFFVGGLAGAVYTVFLFLALGPFLLWMTGLPPADLHDFYYIRNDLPGFLLLLAVACFWVIPYEEIIFRGFIFSTVYGRIAARGFWPAAALTSVVFALYHWQEGYSAVISIFITSLAIFAVYQLSHRNLWYVIFFHIVSDVLLLNWVRMGYL